MVKSKKVLTDPDTIKLVRGFKQKPGCCASQNFRIGWLNRQSIQLRTRNQDAYHWKMINVETAMVYITTTVVMRIRMSFSSAIGNMRR